MTVLKNAAAGASGFSSVRVAPLYDAVTTRVFPNLEHDHDRMALKMAGKDERLKRADFRRFTATAEIPAAAADIAMDERVTLLERGLQPLVLPPPPTDGSEGAEWAAQMRKIVEAQLAAFG